MDMVNPWYYKAQSGVKELMGATLAGTNMQYFNLKAANLTGADLSNSNLSFADLREADLTDANLSNTNMEGVRINQNTRGDVELMKKLGALLR